MKVITHVPLLINNDALVAARGRSPNGTIVRFVDENIHPVIFEDGETYGISSSGNYMTLIGDLKNCSIYTNAHHDIIREYATWGTRGINNDKPVKWVLLKDLCDDHIQAILNWHVELSIKEERTMRSWRTDAMQEELKYRDEGIYPNIPDLQYDDYTSAPTIEE